MKQLDNLSKKDLKDTADWINDRRGKIIFDALNDMAQEERIKATPDFNKDGDPQKEFLRMTMCHVRATDYEYLSRLKKLITEIYENHLTVDSHI